MSRAVAIAIVVAGAGAGAASVASAAPPPIRGVALGVWGGDAPDDDRGAALDELVALGATHVSIPVFFRQEHVRSNAVAAAEGVTISDDRLRAILRAARARGLDVMLFPIVEVARRKAGEWRGTLAPKDPDAWWNSYERFILHYARIAAEEDVAIFSVGSELGSTEAWRDRWIHLIAAVEKIYPRELVYSANWDHYDRVSFFERVDLVGISAYPELARHGDASERELAAAWRDVRDDWVAFAAKIDRPLVLTEVGWPSRDGAAMRPWDYTRDAAVDLEEQRRSYAAFVAAWDRELALGGVFFWIWSGDGGAKDGDYTPRGKPAERVVRSWWGAPDGSAELRGR